MKKKLRILLIWTLVSLLVQFGGYSLLNNQVQKVMSPVASEPITLQLKATIPGANLNNIQVSYAKDYLAYTENGTLKVFNLTKGNIVFEKKSPTATDKTLGVLTYQWLPDRNILLYFYAKRNTNEVTTIKVYPPKIPAPLVKPRSEDPNHPKVVTKEVAVAPRYEKRYGNPQITELYSLELGNSDEDTESNDFLNAFDPASGNEIISAGGKIEQFVVSPTTNLMYLNVKSNSTQALMKIDVMKEVTTLPKSGGEMINQIATSDRFGTLYIDSQVGNPHQVIALEGTKRKIVSDNVHDRILGIRKGKVYIGQVENDQLVKIKTTPDLVEMTDNPPLKTEWVGSIPFNKDVRWLIGAKDQVIIYDLKTAYIVTAGNLKEVKLQGDENYVSVDGAELIRLTKQVTTTLVELQPLKP